MIGRRLAAVAAVAVMLVSCSQDKLIKVKTPARPAGQEDMIGFAAEPLDTVRIGFIGLGSRGPGAIKRMAQVDGARIMALCDIREERVRYSQQRLNKYGGYDADLYYGDDECWKEVCERPDINLIYISTDWASHAPIAIYAMEHGKHVALEVPAAQSLDELWALINTSERTRRHCMMLENCCYDYFELTALNMAQQGVFGEIIHAEGGYVHTLDDIWDGYWKNWRLEFNKDHRGDIYPTHGLGPLCQVLNIHRGDRMTRLVAMDTHSWRGREQWEERFGPMEDEEFKAGDHTTTLIQTHKGKTILIEHNVMTPRPYNRLYQLTGTKGFANKYPVEGFLVQAGQVGDGDMENLEAHSFVSDDVRDNLMQKYKHPILAEIEDKAKSVGGHGGMDYIMDYRLVYCLRNGLPLDMDVYDLAEWSCLGELTRISLEHGCAPVEIPDFTRGDWNKLYGYHHAFAK